MRLPSGNTLVLGCFQAVMEQLTSDIPGGAVYLDDILVSRSSAMEHLNNLCGLLQRLNKKATRCQREKCHFAKPRVKYLVHILSLEGIAKGTKVHSCQHQKMWLDLSPS